MRAYKSHKLFPAPSVEYHGPQSESILTDEEGLR
jgi:hypothetical protein